MLAITSLGLFALASQKLLPSMQLIYNSYAKIKGCIASVQRIKDLVISNQLVKEIIPEKDSYLFKNKFELRNISFLLSRFKPLFSNINLEIKEEKIGLIGKTGCGKSTLTSIILGLLEPNNGKIFLDENLVNSSKEKLN